MTMEVPKFTIKNEKLSHNLSRYISNRIRVNKIALTKPLMNKLLRTLSINIQIKSSNISRDSNRFFIPIAPPG